VKRESNPCPEPEVLAAFAAGNLSGAELEMTAEHLRECRDCRRVVAEAVRFEPLSQALREPKRRSRLPVWFAAAAALAGVGFLSVWMIRSSRATAPMRALVAAAPADGRYLEARVSGGFPWAPLRPAARGTEPPAPSQMKLVGAAGKVIEQTAGDSSIPARQAAAIARLLTGNAADATAQLSALTSSAREAPVWSDLAAARFTEALQNDEGKAKFAQALAATDEALRIDPSYPEALFNRALILEHLGVRDQARLAWKRYLSVDSTSAWAREAERHLRGLERVTQSFPKELERTYAALEKNASADVSGLVVRFPQECRVWGESEILKCWAEAELAGRSENAAIHLRLARTFGQELVRRRHEGMLNESVAAIEHATVATRRTLAAAHIRLRAAQAAYKARNVAIAEQLYREAAAMFEAGGSPMALVARYFAANMAYEQERKDEAQVQLVEVLNQCRPEFIANIAGIQWELGLCYTAKGQWGRALDSLNKSIEGFQSLGESNNAASVREILATVYDLIGEPRKAWIHRFVVLQELGLTESMRLQVAIYSIARRAALNHDWPMGLSFVNLQIDMGRQPGDELLYTLKMLLRASILGQMGQQRAARDDLARATAVIPSIRDVDRRERVEAELLAVEGFLAPSPAGAIAAWSRAIDYQRTKGRRVFLPELFLYRGRSLVEIGQRDRAAEDFEAGIRELENQRVSIAAADDRWGMFGMADELFDDAVVLALQKGDAAGAFAYSERARARELLDAMGVAVSAPRSPVPDAVILEYVQLADRMFIFVIDGERLRVVRQELSSAVVSPEIERLVQSAVRGDGEEFKRLASVLYDRLLGPVADELASSKTLVIVPDGTLSLVPFSALIDPAGRYVIERRPVVVTPSVGVFLRSAPHKQQFGRASRLLMIAGPAAREGDLGTLTSEQREIDSIAAEYGGNVDYARAAPIDEVLGRRTMDANVIHFVGHAVLPDQDSGGALVTSRRDQLDVREIASMHFHEIGLVVLAACGTARGNGRAGEASISVARAFLVAGVPSVVATLWPIEDTPSAEFFPRFHHYLMRGLPPAEALRAVQMEWIRRHDGSPGVWAAVQIVGT
jgi:CHAT domain-containing protein